MPKILVCDDDVSIGKTVKATLSHLLNVEVVTVTEGEAVLKLLEDNDFNAVLLDQNLPRVLGLDVLRTIKANYPSLPVIIITGQRSTQLAIDSMKVGAFDFIKKPFNIQELADTVKKALELSIPDQQTHEIPEDVKPGPLALIGDSPAMIEVYKLIGQVSRSDATVLIQGESGTGKEMIANAIYRNSQRADEPFIAVNCAAIPEGLLESELFGHEKGSFTGAVNRKIGKFELCHKGTIFLDEIGDMSLSTQSKILRILQEGAFERVGGTQTIQVDVRIIAATNVDLKRAIEEQRFRSDLYYRLKVFSIDVPPLRERKSDIKHLTEYFIRKFALKNNKNIKNISESALQTLVAYSWPGNVRELENCLERAVILAKGDTILEEYLPMPQTQTSISTSAFELPDEASMEEVEKIYITHILNKTGWKMSETSEVLKIHRNTLRRKIKSLGITQDI